MHLQKEVITSPKISIIIPTYNREAFIAEAIDRVLAQEYKNFELIIVDDGSTDHTKEIVHQYGGKVRYLYQPNLGPSASRNLGIQHAKGKYIAFCDSDDLFLPQKLAKQMDYIRKHPNTPFLYTWYYQTHQQNKSVQIRKPSNCENREHLQYCLFTRKFTIRTSTVLVKKSCFNKAGLFNQKFSYSQDWDMWLRFAAYYPGACLEEPLSEYRLHTENRSSHGIRIYHPEIRASILKLYQWDDEHLALLEKKYGRQSYENDQTSH
ncbi:glycosyltransferase family 2 protein [Sporolactobacillus kofuensis]|uniref:Glycosyltransferase family 2 protein n=1 Tax=Sporolactobacillus kofuensis TaxID=269672 RepID=A0ABW1WCR7_9BACL|nr:glycosyltransferase [Sporolactobacillus kofuensis]MCO7175207.1 glycosyltransferase [Sporolactobacillus kofuensis]